MLDGAEDILREEGYAALTSRRVAERIGVKQRLVYYYFRTMDDLIVETFRRLAERELERLTKALAKKRPLREIWKVEVQTADSRLISEFMALANRIESLRDEVVAYIEITRKMQVTALTDAMQRKKKKRGSGVISPMAAVILSTSAALTMHREKALGIRAGHSDVSSLIDEFISEWDMID